MKNEFAIACHSFQEACDLYNEAYRHGYKYFFTGIPFTSEKFRLYKTIHFGKDDLFCIANPEGLTKIYPYSKQKAIELLSGKEEEKEFKIIQVTQDNLIGQDRYRFIFSDGSKTLLQTKQWHFENEDKLRLELIKQWFKDNDKPELKIQHVNIDLNNHNHYIFFFNDNHEITCHKEWDKFVTKRRPDQDSIINEEQHWKLIKQWFEEKRLKLNEPLKMDMQGEAIQKKELKIIIVHEYQSYYHFYFNDYTDKKVGKLIIRTIHKHEPIDKYYSLIRDWYIKEMKPGIDNKLKSISVLSNAENMSPYPYAYNAEFENGVNVKFYMDSPFDNKIYCEEDSILKGEYEKAVAEFIMSKHTWPVKEISKEHKLNKPLKITAVSKKLEQKTPSGQTVPKGPIKVFAIIRYTISFNDGYTINCLYDTNNNRKKVIQSKKFTITDKHLELIYDYIDKDNNQRPFSEWVKSFDEVWKPTGNMLKFIKSLAEGFSKEEIEFQGGIPIKTKLAASEANKNLFKDLPDHESNKIKESEVEFYKQQYKDTSFELAKLEEQHAQDLLDWHNEYTELKSKFKRLKAKKRELKKVNEDLIEYRKGDEIWANNIYKQIQRIFPDSKNAVSLLAWLQDKQPEEKTTEHERVELKSLYEVLNESVPEFIKKASFKERIECLQKYFNERHISHLGTIESLNDKLQRTENEYKKLDNFYSKFKAKYPNETRVKMVQFEIIYNKLLDEYKDEIIDQYKTLINEKEIISDEDLYKAVKKAAKKVNKEIDNFIDANDDLAKVPKQEAKPEKLIVKVGLMYKGRRVKDNKWLHGKLVTIKEAGEKGTVILKNEKGNHEVVYRTLIML